jgi:hypothetical protein
VTAINFPRSLIPSRSRNDICPESGGDELFLQDVIRKNNREIMKMNSFLNRTVTGFIILILRFIVLNDYYGTKIAKTYYIQIEAISPWAFSSAVDYPVTFFDLSILILFRRLSINASIKIPVIIPIVNDSIIKNEGLTE